MKPEDLKEWRRKNGYSQSQLAKVLKVVTHTVSRWERAERAIPSFLHLTLKCVEKKKGGKKRRKK